MSDPVTDLVAEWREFSEEVNGHLTTVTADLKDHAAWISESAPVIDQHSGMLTDHAAQLATDLVALVEMREQLNLVLAEMPRQPKHPPIRWETLTAEKANQLWPALGSWVDRILIRRYFTDRAHLPDCWALHPGAVEEVSWLFTSWLHAYLTNAGPVAAAEWHTRWRTQALDGVAAAVLREATTTRSTTCGPGVHFGVLLPGTQRPTPPPAPGPVPTSAPVPPPVSATQPQPWDAPAPDPPTTQDYGRDLTADLAERSLWWPHLELAWAQDVAARREKEQQAQD